MNETMKFGELLTMLPEKVTDAKPALKYLSEHAVPVASDKYMEIVVYHTGFIRYTAHKSNNIVILNIHQCREYTYTSEVSEWETKIAEEEMLNMNWQIPVTLAGEQRIAENRMIIEEIRHRHHPEIDPDTLTNPDFLDDLFQKQYTEALLSCLTQKQYEVIIRYYFIQQSQQMIAEDMHIRRQTVQEIRQAALKRMRNHAADLDS